MTIGMDHSVEKHFCCVCFDKYEEFYKWSGGLEFLEVDVDTRKDFWIYANANLTKECVAMGPEPFYAAPYCLRCLQKLVKWFEEQVCQEEPMLQA